jgi:cyclase
MRGRSRHTDSHLRQFLKPITWMCLCWTAVFSLIAPTTASAADSIFKIVKVTDGVYAAIAKPTFRLNCNAAIIVQDDDVVVVDAESVPSAAGEVIKAIKAITDKPVKYLIITHFHGDHFQGAEAYVKAWPSVQIISSYATRENIEKLGIPRMKREMHGLPDRIGKLKVELQRESDPKKREEIQLSLSQAERYYAELRTTRVVLPTLTVSHRLILHSEMRTVQILYLGVAHTDGDLFVYVPKERVIITGDALHSGTPTLTDASPLDWIRTLDAAEKLDFDYVIGGHGDVTRGKANFELWKQYFTDLMTDTARASADGETLTEARATVAPILTTKYGESFENIPAPFSHTVDANIDRAFQIVSGPWAQ